ncbi:MAG: glycosyltransferase family 9 protein [Gammaproteobacteria bacterium]|nr:glycosyltransferase family 9 protein [Gammaproteobacteria bacterium]
MNDDVKSVLLVSLSCVGDAVMTTPVLQSLNSLYPQAKIDIVSDSRSHLIYNHCPYLGNIFLKNKARFMRGALDLVFTVRKKKYDLIVDLRTDGLAYLLKGKDRLTKFGAVPYGKHAVENLMGVIRRIHGEQEIPDTRVWITGQEEKFAEDLLGPLPGGTWLAVVPDNLDNRKTWPEENYVNLINYFSNQLDGVIFEGSSAERGCADRIASRINVPSVNLAGKTNLLQAAAVIKRAKAYIGGDSGLGHVAGAMETPSLLFFSVDKPERVLPWRASASYLVSRDSEASSIPLADAIVKFEAFLAGIQDLNKSFV